MFGFYGFQVGRIGIDVREDFWVYWQKNHFFNDPQSALYNGRFILRQAIALEHEDQVKIDSQGTTVQPTDEPNIQPTIGIPGPGLFDSPLSLHSFSQRYKSLRPVYGHIFRGWVSAYDNLVRDQTDGNYEMDYPPLRSLAMTLWAWKVQADFPSLYEFPRHNSIVINPRTQQRQVLSPDIIRPLVECNVAADAVSSLAMFCLVWIWTGRATRSVDIKDRLHTAWGDRLLLLAPISLGAFYLLQPYFTFTANGFSHGSAAIDMRITSVGWWTYLLLRYLSVIALARFLPGHFRAVACALVAATLVWLNPASMLDSVGWPQWEVWLLPFFLVGAVLVSLDCWLAAGLVLAVGGMFKGQLYFVAPVLVLAPLFAGWIGRFLRMLIGIATGAGLVVWPWLVVNSRAESCIVGCVFSAAVVCGVSMLRAAVIAELRQHLSRLRGRAIAWRDSRRNQSSDESPAALPPVAGLIRWPLWTAIGVAMLISAALPLLIWREQDPSLHPCTLALTLSILLIPWFIRRRLIPVVLTGVFAASLWLAGASLGGSFSWWLVGFKYGTEKHQTMQLGGESLSNLSSLLDQRYGWGLHDSVGTLQIPFAPPIPLDVQSFSALLFAISLILCSIGAGVHLRRNDPKFLAVIVAPWMLFIALLTQMAARYTIFPAVLAAAFVGLSFSLSLIPFVLTVLSFVMLGNQLLLFDTSTAPVMFSITHPTYPDMGWLTLGLAGILLVISVIPSRRITRLSRCAPFEMKVEKAPIHMV
jgi:hypothetical protein